MTLSPFFYTPNSFGSIITAVCLHSCVNSTASCYKPPLAVIAPSYLSDVTIPPESPPPGNQRAPCHVAVLQLVCITHQLKICAWHLPPRRPHAQPTQHRQRNPTQGPFPVREVHTHDVWHITLEPHPSTSGRALFKGEQYPSPLQAFVGCRRGLFGGTPWSEPSFVFVGFTPFVTSLVHMTYMLQLEGECQRYDLICFNYSILVWDYFHYYSLFCFLIL